MAITAPAPRVIADAIPRSFARDTLLVVGAAAFVGLAAQIVIPLPFTPVPVTGQTFAVLLAGAAIGPLRGVLSMLLYSVAGLLGVPWFAGGASGWTTASFGYIVGFILAAGLVGWLAQRGWTRTAIDTALAMVLGNVLIYAVGVTWLKVAIDAGWGEAVAMGMTPFLLGDALKIALAAGLFPLVWRQLERHGFVSRGTEGSGKTLEEAAALAQSDSVVDLTESDSESTIDLRDRVRDSETASGSLDSTER